MTSKSFGGVSGVPANCEVVDQPIVRYACHIDNFMPVLYRRSMASRIDLDVDRIIRLHFDELRSVKEVAEVFGVSRDVIVRHIREQGLTQRGKSSAMRARWSKLTQEERDALVRPAHDAVRGVKFDEERVRRMVARRAGVLKSRYEERVFAAIEAHGLNPSPGYQVERFLVDIAFPDVKLAVEVDGGHWHSAPRKATQDARKTARLSVLGWDTLRIQVTKKTPDSVIADFAEEVAAIYRGRVREAAALDVQGVSGGGEDASTVAEGDTE